MAAAPDERTKLVQRASASDAAAAPERPSLLLCASDVPDKGTLMRAVKTSVTVVEYDFEALWLDVEKLVEASRRDVEASGELFESIALVTHGGPGEIFLTESVTISHSTLFSVDVAVFMKKVCALMKSKAEGGRLDILGCNVAEGAEGEQLVKEIEEVYGVEVAASDDVTARGDGRCCGVARPADMVLETDNIDAGSVYFTDGIKSWEGRLKGGCHMGCWLCLRAVICPKSPTDRAFRWCVGVVVGVILLMVLLAELGLLKIYCPEGMTVANGEDGN